MQKCVLNGSDSEQRSLGGEIESPYNASPHLTAHVFLIPGMCRDAGEYVPESDFPSGAQERVK